MPLPATLRLLDQAVTAAGYTSCHTLYNCIHKVALFSFLANNSDSGGNLLRSVPFVMSGHLIFNFFQTLGTPLFKTNPNNGCPKRIYPHSGQARKHFSHRFHS